MIFIIYYIYNKYWKRPMVTKKLYIKEMSDIEYVIHKQNTYSFAFRRLYKMLEECADDSFVLQFKETFNLNEIEWRSLLTDVKSFRNREIELRKEKEEKIAFLQDELENGDLTKKQRYKSIKKLHYFLRTLDRESTFGGLVLQRRLTKECNKKIKDQDKIDKLRKEFRENRVLPFSLMGEANQKGNRFFDFSNFENGLVIYKPHKGKKIEIKFKVCKNQFNELRKVRGLVERCGLSVSVKLSKDYIYLSYDEEALAGYNVDEKERKKEIDEIKKQHHPKPIQEDLIKKVYQRYYDAQDMRKCKDKIVGRCLAIDMNPTNIGWSVIGMTEEGYNVLACGNYDISKWCENNPKHQTYVNNKRKYELSIIAKQLFKTCEHYRCSQFAMENLKFKGKAIKDGNRNGNRLIKNVWNRELFTNLIRRRCNENGVILREVNPVYTSFIGNVQHKYMDATNASIEIGRRGLYKYTKGTIYPLVREEDIATLEAKFVDKLSDVELCSTAGWDKLYKSLKSKCSNATDFSHRWRAGLGDVETDYEVFSLNSCRSRVNSIIFK